MKCAPVLNKNKYAHLEKNISFYFISNRNTKKNYFDNIDWTNFDQNYAYILDAKYFPK